VVHRGLVIVAWICCFFVVASFSLFALDQIAGASKHQQTLITSSSTVTPIPPEAKHHGQPRQFIDDVAHTLTSPFGSIVQSDSQWVLRGIPTIVAVLVYGVGLGYLARFSRGWS
jgi:hypothetical protein